jgi:hypothetical protein
MDHERLQCYVTRTSPVLLQQAFWYAALITKILVNRFLETGDTKRQHLL